MTYLNFHRKSELNNIVYLFRLLNFNISHRLFLPVLFLFLISCSSPSPPANTVKPKSHSKNKSAAARPLPSSWSIMKYPGAHGDQAARKYVKCETDGKFSNSTVSNEYLNAVIIVDKINAGILLHQSKKSNPARKFAGLVHIKMKNPAGNELDITSSRAWNKSGGILIERNNNDYSQFRIFMLQSDGVINVEVRDDSSSVYHFEINAFGFSDAFSQI